MDGFCLLKKVADKSLLTEGFAIPLTYQQLFYEQLGFTLNPGEHRQILLMVDGAEYPMKITNTGFDRNRFDHTDQLQIRYTPNSPLAKHFQREFSLTAQRVREFYAARTGRERFIPAPDEREYLAVYATPVPGVLMADCITCNEYSTEVAELRQFDELTFENLIDANADLVFREGTRKVRRLTRAIGDNLKLLYGYRCQICGQYIGKPYDSHVIHAHHIDYFVRSMNNDSDNILIVCPNHHTIIHDRNPVFDRSKLQYLYPNGYAEGLILNQHLKKAE